MAAVRTAAQAPGIAPQGRRQGRLLDTRITQRRPTRLLRDMGRLALEMATGEETATDRIRQLPATARAAAMDRARRTLPAATARRAPTRRRAPMVVAVPTLPRAPMVVAVVAIAAEVVAVVAIAAEAAMAVDRTPPVAVVAIPVVVVAGTAEAADIANMV